LALDPRRDEITILPVGNPAQIFRALEQGEIDGALVSAAQTRERQAKGFVVLLKEYPSDISSYGGGLVVSTAFLSTNRGVVSKVTAATRKSKSLLSRLRLPSRVRETHALPRPEPVVECIARFSTHLFRAYFA
jgi:hypothetical protein